MKNVQVRHVSERTHAALVRRAAQAGMSLQEYLLATLTEAVEKPTLDEVLARAGGRAGGRIGFATAVKDVRRERDRA